MHIGCSHNVETIAAESIAQVVNAGLCIGCGLCEAISNRKIKMQMNIAGSLKPVPDNGFTKQEERLLLSVCPGIHITPRQQSDHPVNVNTATFSSDEIWGEYTSMRYAWAATPKVRHIGSTGGVLTALAHHLLNTRQVAFIYHVKADPAAPVQSIATVSETADDVLSGAGSRYGPVAPLTGLLAALDRDAPFAVVGKPCDLSAIHNMAKHDNRINKLITHRLTMVCGGQSTAQKSREILHNAAIQEHTVTLYRHRGYGNPGPTRIESSDGKTLEISYQNLWKDESSWGIEPRCKLCPDALGEAADIAAADVWPGGSPEGEDEGFNGIVTRSLVGENLIRDAEEAGELILGDHISPQQFNDFQPHQVRKKRSLQSRYLGLRDAKLPDINAPYSRLDSLGSALDSHTKEKERAGTARRFGKAPQE